ncbi:hypothetical protein PpBr36_04032 [Pyricularia pennisetigena]|uniref:hypothetical protein n=1 Tax=Pyricularia pennisetigena TaxID=1578925 RepID=UPI001150CD7F|nr:hypothetical protein PpBr36_04032 [Pyricularia pennisetigena]TLS26659.1 hypothetical protein PpBr36_04032 [Pyricularia pennisetigena]
MPSVKQTLILLPLLGLAVAAPTNLPRDLGNAGGDAPNLVLDARDHYAAGGSGNWEDEADALNDAIQSGSAQHQKRGTLTDGSELVAGTAGRTINFLGNTGKKFFTAVPDVWNEFWGNARGKPSKRDVAGASVDAAGALSRRRVPAAQPGGYDGMDATVPASPAIQTTPQKPKSQNAVANLIGSFRTSPEDEQKKISNKLLDAQVKNADRLRKEAEKDSELDRKQRKFDFETQQAQWEADNTVTGAIKKKVIGKISGSAANPASLGSVTPSKGGYAPAAPVAAASVPGMSPTGQNPRLADPAGALDADDTINPAY